jgi:hypothetical protein
LLLAALIGVLRTIGSVLFLTAIDKVGLSRSNQRKNLQGPIGAILMLVFLSEFFITNLLFIFLSIFAIFISALLFTIKNEKETTIDKKGIIFAVVSAFFFGTGALIQKYLVNHGYLFGQQVYFSLFTFLTAMLFLCIRKQPLNELKKFYKKDNLWAIVG